ncbi:MAG TPA: translation initiation factor IF-2 N-terminal domain-containing protein, partial [Candidatus Aquilonibacter sp.]
MATSTGKVRIFELAKEVGLTSKELIALFNDRLGGVFEAKNQLSVVPENIADLVRSVLKPAAPPKA